MVGLARWGSRGLIVGPQGRSHISLFKKGVGVTARSGEPGLDTHERPPHETRRRSKGDIFGWWATAAVFCGFGTRFVLQGETLGGAVWIAFGAGNVLRALEAHFSERGFRKWALVLQVIGGVLALALLIQLLVAR